MIKFFRKRHLWLPTWPTVLIFVFVTGLLGWLVVANIYPYLAVNEPAEDAKVLIVEGWVSDKILEETFANFQPGHPYDLVCTTGGSLPRGSHLNEYNSFAELAARTIEKLGVPEELIIIATPEDVPRDRTYHAALGFKNHSAASENATLRNVQAVDVLTQGVHGRRTRTVFRKVLGDDIDVGIISPPSGGYDTSKWFVSSEGVKDVIMESISVGYEWLGKKNR